jgi:hypothetical protein
MKDKTIDYILRATWQAVSRIIQEASKYEPQWQLVFLLSMDKNIGTPLHHWDQKWEWRLQSYQNLKSMEEKLNHPKEKSR